VRKVRLVLLAFAIVCLGAARASAQDATDSSLVFAGYAQSYGLQASVNIPKAPLADTLVDVTAPSTTAELDSIGTSVGFAAVPSPGDLVLSVPGLVSGLVAQGAAGLPPIPIPSLPDYPLFVRADSSNPTQNLGDGPYQLRASSADAQASGTAQAGVSLDALGKVALTTSSSKVEVVDGTAVASSTSSIQGLSIGPLVIGEITTTAKVTLSGSTPEASSEVHIVGARVAGLPVEVGKDGITLLGTSVPLPIGDTIASILSAAGLKVEFLSATHDGGTATAQGLRIVQSIPGGLGAGDGTLTLTFGYASARMTPPPGQASFDGSGATAGGEGNIDLPADTGVVPSIDSGGDLSLPPATGTPAAAPASSVGERPTADRLQLTGLSEAIDLRSIYMAGAVLALLALAVSFLIQLLGVRT
jgi:hypothetical protein